MQIQNILGCTLLLAINRNSRTGDLVGLYHNRYEAEASETATNLVTLYREWVRQGSLVWFIEVAVEEAAQQTFF